MIVMIHQLLLVLCCLVAVSVPGCSKETQLPQKPQNPPSNSASRHGADTDAKQADELQGFIGIVTSQKLPLSNTKTIGAAFGDYRYFKTRHWKETRNNAGKVYVDFRGLFADEPIVASIRDGVSRQGIEVKFVVEPNGNFYVGMVSRIDVMNDGMMRLSPLGDGKKIVEMIYDNREITF